MARDCSILVVEDDLSLAKQYLESLERLGVGELHLAINLATAHRICTRHSLSGVVMDYGLSGGADTYVLGQFLRQKGIPFIAVSGYSLSDIPSGFEPNVFLQKPVRPEDFEVAVCSVFAAAKLPIFT